MTSTDRFSAMGPSTNGSATVICSSITRVWMATGNMMAEMTAARRPPASWTSPRKKAASESGLLTARSSSDPPRMATTDR